MGKDIFKKIRLISKSGFLASSLINIEAMEKNGIINESKINNKIKTLELILNPQKEDLTSLNNEDTLNKTDALYNQLDNENVPFYKILDIKDFKELINKEYKEDILWPIKLGNKAREIAYYLSQNLRKYISKQKDYNESDMIKYFSLLEDYFKKKHKNKDIDINPKDTALGKIYNPIIEKFKSQNTENEIFKINQDFDWSKLTLIDPSKFNNDHIHNIGRCVLHGITKDIYNEKLEGIDKGSSELKRLFNGEINCTCNAFMLYTFLRLNKILCYTYMKYCHEFVLIPLKDEKNKAIKFYTVDLNEEETINDMSFDVKDIIKISKNNDIWRGMNISDKEGNSLSKHFMFHRGFTPTYIYYQGLGNFIYDINWKIKIKKYKFENINNDIELIKYYLNGLKHAWKYIKKHYQDEQGNYIVKFLPIEKGNCLFLPQVLYLGEPKLVELDNGNFKYKKIMFNSKKPGEYLNLMYAYIDIPYKYNEELEYVKLKINKRAYEDYYIDYSILYKEDTIVENKCSDIQNKMRDKFVKVCDINNN